MTRVLLSIVSVLLLAGCTTAGTTGSGSTPPPQELAPALETPRPISDACRDAIVTFGQASPDDAIAQNEAGLVVTDSCATWTELLTVVTENPTALGYATAEEIDQAGLAQRVCGDARADTSICLEAGRLGLL